MGGEGGGGRFGSSLTPGVLHQQEEHTHTRVCVACGLQRRAAVFFWWSGCEENTRREDEKKKRTVSTLCMVFLNYGRSPPALNPARRPQTQVVARPAGAPPCLPSSARRPARAPPPRPRRRCRARSLGRRPPGRQRGRCRRPRAGGAVRAAEVGAQCPAGDGDARVRPRRLVSRRAVRRPSPAHAERESDVCVESDWGARGEGEGERWGRNARPAKTTTERQKPTETPPHTVWGGALGFARGLWGFSSGSGGRRAAWRGRFWVADTHTHPQLVVIEDALTDPRTRFSPLVDTGGLRFYAGAPLIASTGARLGSLCITDVSPRSLTRDQGRLLANFAEVAVRALERDYYDRYALPAAVPPSDGPRRVAPPTASRLLRSVDTVRRAAAIVDASPDGGWPILCANTRWAFLSGAAGTPPRPAAVIGASFFALYAPLHGDEASVRADLAAAVAAGAGTDFVVDLTPCCGGSDADGTNPPRQPRAPQRRLVRRRPHHPPPCASCCAPASPPPWMTTRPRSSCRPARPPTTTARRRSTSFSRSWPPSPLMRYPPSQRQSLPAG